MLADHHIDRHSYCIAIGGGAMLDAVGLVAATTHRGVRHIRMPTTVLSQNDSGVGVKNAVNQFGQKNFVGTFAPPFAVLNDLDFIIGLPDREKIGGMAEAVKVALIRDQEFFAWLEQNADALATFETDAMAYMIRRCAELHMRQIGQGGDPFETGSARPLDYGHWSAHKLEGMTNYHLRHGEAVAIGIALDARYSVLAGLLDAGEDDRICFLLEHLGFKLWHPVIEKTTADGVLVVLKGLRDFQEHLGGQLTVTLLSDIGVGVEVNDMDDAHIRDAIAWLKNRQSDRAGAR
ncbi:MAG: 3-dehydroquinate synthase, partial [Pseudomonadota bacterium]